VRSSKAFSVHILGHGQSELAQLFATALADKFPANAFTPGVTGAPALAECDVRLDCELVSETPGGTHGIFVGLVRHIECRDIQPLIYANRTFWQARSLEASPAP
jgi:flavin reductase (DIM6/NTAB) family NADH-FMN oxidoreductase RutF